MIMKEITAKGHKSCPLNKRLTEKAQVTPQGYEAAG